MDNQTGNVLAELMFKAATLATMDQHIERLDDAIQGYKKEKTELNLTKIKVCCQFVLTADIVGQDMDKANAMAKDFEAYDRKETVKEEKS